MSLCISNQSPQTVQWIINTCLDALLKTHRFTQKYQKAHPGWLVERGKAWVTSQQATKRNRLLLLCMITVGTGLKGVFVCPGGSQNGMAWLCGVACGLVQLGMG